ncbi:hypothetical protein HNQ79_001819 [Streptomyces candidus]|uniref:Uncharacterized protein n=1 Tax=Streptomyces candidus TaxID=67283 RepID=A0A7X0HD25_9ACTN|nr:hypothetical protein [Streptomyces candidus]GHH47781.1 hypothetical protein GCM10018773_40910 [Streptomyces candidus]
MKPSAVASGGTSQGGPAGSAERGRRAGRAGCWGPVGRRRAALEGQRLTERRRAGGERRAPGRQGPGHTTEGRRTETGAAALRTGAGRGQRTSPMSPRTLLRDR